MIESGEMAASGDFQKQTSSSHVSIKLWQIHVCYRVYDWVFILHPLLSVVALNSDANKM